MLYIYTYVGRQEEAEIILESLKTLPSPYREMAVCLVESCAYAGTGNVLKMQNLLHICSKHLEAKEEPKKDDKKPQGTAAAGAQANQQQQQKVAGSEFPVGWLEQAVAVLGMGLIASAEDVGNQMSLRTFGHLVMMEFYCQHVITENF